MAMLYIPWGISGDWDPAFAAYFALVMSLVFEYRAWKGTSASVDLMLSTDQPEAVSDRLMGLK